MFTFKYSKRPNTPALQYEDHIPEEEKQRRLLILQEKQRAIQIRRNASYIGADAGGAGRRIQQGDGPVDRPHIAEQDARISTHAASAGDSLAGTYLPVLVTRAGPNRWSGESVAAVRLRLRNREERTMEVEMKIRGLTMDPVTQMPIVVLKDVNGNTVLPIWVGIFEANAIALEIEKVSTPRPMTHDLMKTVLMGLEAGVRKVVVSDLQRRHVLRRDLAGARTAS